jgi:hypothetical protein
VHDEAAGSSYLGIWDAATMDDAPLARVALPARVPYGFHAAWVGREAFGAQLRSAPLAAAPLEGATLVAA